MKGHLIIGKHHAFYHINNDLIKVNINGNNNKIENPFRIINLFIQGNNNNVEIVEGGTINHINIFGNNNKIHIKNNSFSHYFDRGIGNQIIRYEPPLIPSNRIRPINLLSNNNINFVNLINHNNQNNNINNTQNRTTNFINGLEEYFYFEVPIYLKCNNLNKCSLCDKLFTNNEKVKIFSCKQHIFHTDCLKKWSSSHINSINCPKCENNNSNLDLNILASPFFPIHPLNLNSSRRIRLQFSPRHNSFDDLDDELYDDDFHLDHDLEEGDIDDELDDLFLGRRGLNKEILDNMEISKIKNVDKLDNDKKKCTICLENYVNGDESIALPCIHIFHATCIKTWLKNQNTCPICKFEIKYEMEDIENEEL